MRFPDGNGGPVVDGHREPAVCGGHGERCAAMQVDVLAGAFTRRGLVTVGRGCISGCMRMQNRQFRAMLVRRRCCVVIDCDLAWGDVHMRGPAVLVHRTCGERRRVPVQARDADCDDEHEDVQSVASQLAHRSEKPCDLSQVK